MSNQKTAITADDLVSMARAAGLRIEVQSSWTKCHAPKGALIYVANAKKEATRVHVAGFVPDQHPAMARLSPEEAKRAHLGSVRGVIDFKLVDPSLALEAFEAAIEQALVAEGNVGRKSASKSAELVAANLGK